MFSLSEIRANAARFELEHFVLGSFSFFLASK
jgi:hypothetical protein